MGATLKKYLGLYRALFQASLIADLEYRINFVTRIVTDIFWYMAQIVTFKVLFMHTQTIGNWNFAQMRVFLGILFVVDALYMVMLHDNLDRISEKVRKGELDLVLAKPVNSQFMMSFQRVSTALLGNLTISIGWLVYSLIMLGDFSIERLLWLIVLIPCSFAVLYACRFVFASLSLILVRAENLQYIWYQVYKLGMRPDSIYSPWIKFTVLTIIPVGVIASVPARALLDPPDYGLFAWTAVLAVVSVWLSTKMWRFALRFYASASS